MVPGIPGPLDVEPPRAGKEGPGPPVTRRHHTIKEVDAEGNGQEEIPRGTDPHEVPGPIGGEEGECGPEHRLHLGLALSHTETAHGIPAESKSGELSDPSFSEIGKDAALDNPEEHLIGSLMNISGALGPSQGPVQGIGSLLMGYGVGGALIEWHDDIGLKRLLNGDRLFRGEEVARSVHVRMEEDSVLRDLPERSHAEDLKSPQLLDNVVTGAEVEVVCIAQDELQPCPPDLLRGESLHRPRRGARHEGRGFYRPVEGVESTTPGPGRIDREQLKGHEISTSSKVTASRKVLKVIVPATPAAV